VIKLTEQQARDIRGWLAAIHASNTDEVVQYLDHQLAMGEATRGSDSVSWSAGGPMTLELDDIDGDRVHLTLSDPYGHQPIILDLARPVYGKENR
jgi:hypothetical protein